MKETKRFGSIARKIRSARWWQMVRCMLFVDVCLLALCAAGFAYWAETAHGMAFSPDTPRNILWSEDFYHSEYRFQQPDGTFVQVSMDPYIAIAVKMGTVLLWLEAGYLLIHLFSGRKSARRLLQPLQRVADTTQRLSRSEENKIQNLENALHAVSPGARLETGDPDLRELEKAVNDLLDKMRASYEEQVRFASDASHELRTPIAVIQGYADMLARWGKSDPQVLEESISAIRSETGRMKKLVDQLLFLARGDAGRQKMNPAPLDIGRLAAEVRDECEMIDPGHVWRLNVPDGPVSAVGDGDMLMQTLRILTDNARKFTPEGGTIRIRAGMKNRDPYLEVQDEGSGIAAENLPRIFDRFYREDPARDGQAGGTGLGLSIARWIVERHGGYFDVLSHPGIGTRIRIVLPLPAAE